MTQRPFPAVLLIIVNDASFFLSHRLPIALAARSHGYDVHIASGPGPGVEELASLGFTYHQLPLTRNGKNPARELRGAWAIYRLFRMVRPDVVHLVTIKPVVYGGVAARLARVPAVVAAVSGLGMVFTETGIRATTLRRLVRAAYRTALRHRNIRVIVQNPTDYKTMRDLLTRPDGRIELIRGSGVDLSLCRMTEEPLGAPVVVMAARLLRDKGVFEFVEAARQLRRSGLDARFQLAGKIDPGNSGSVSSAQLAGWNDEGVVEVLGFRSDVAEIFSHATLAVLPSYYGEGLPKVLMEAAACGRPVITTDMPGCRDAVEPDVTGVLIPPRDAAALAEAIRGLLASKTVRLEMGASARALAEREFGIEGIVASHLRIYETLMQAA